MVKNFAQRVRAALTRCLTIAVNAGLVTKTLRIHTAAEDGPTLNIGVTVKSTGTVTRDAVVYRNAIGVFSARVLLARAYAASVQPVAQQMWRTIDIVVADLLRSLVENLGSRQKPNNKMFADCIMFMFYRLLPGWQPV